MQSFDQIALLYLISIPFYLSLAGASFRYRTLKRDYSLRQITEFLTHLHFPLKVLFRPDRWYTYVHLEAIEPQAYFLNANLSEVTKDLVVSIFLGSIFPVALGLAHLVNRVPFGLSNLLEVVFHVGTFIWAIRFGSRIREDIR